MMQQTTMTAGESGAVAVVVTALGFGVPWPELVAGIMFAVAGGFAGMFISPPAQRLSLWVTLFIAALIGMLAGMMHPYFAEVPLVGWIAQVPLQLVMGVAGLSSRWIAKRLSSGRWPIFGSRNDDGAS
jgi:hypothetical protein